MIRRRSRTTTSPSQPAAVRTVDVIDLEMPYWHTPQDTLDKISSKSLTVVGHVLAESIKQLQAKQLAWLAKLLPARE